MPGIHWCCEYFILGEVRASSSILTSCQLVRSESSPPKKWNCSAPDADCCCCGGCSGRTAEAGISASLRKQFSHAPWAAFLPIVACFWWVVAFFWSCTYAKLWLPFFLFFNHVMVDWLTWVMFRFVRNCYCCWNPGCSVGLLVMFHFVGNCYCCWNHGCSVCTLAS